MNEVPDGEGLRRIAVNPGEMQVSADKSLVLVAAVGAGIVTCLFDPVTSVGGANHFLLPAWDDADDDSASCRAGLHAMELLINAMLAKGASRVRLKARIFGGASDGLEDGGAARADALAGSNLAFARRFLRDERITLIGEDVGGGEPRRVEFQAALGLARCDRLDGNVPAVLPLSPAVAGPGTPYPIMPGEAEFF